MKLSDSIIYNKVSHKEGAINKVISAWNMLHQDTDYIDDSSYPTSVITKGDISITLLFENLPSEILSTLPIPDHVLYDYDTGMNLFYESFNDAIEIIDNHISCSFNDTIKFCKVFVPVKLSKHSTQKLITSLTIPDLPFLSFISENAFVHLAPDVISHGFTKYYLAENIFHEMIHNQINIMLLEKEILIDEYSSEASPKIEIPWRKGSEVRNQYWELDRMLHAYFVYKGLYKFRLKMSEIYGSGIDTSMVCAAMENANYLKGKIIENSGYLTKEGLLMLNMFDFAE